MSPKCLAFLLSHLSHDRSASNLFLHLEMPQIPKKILVIDVLKIFSNEIMIFPKTLFFQKNFNNKNCQTYFAKFCDILEEVFKKGKYL